ncbi:MAG: Long-chain-fatty-acid--CoA ligase [Syntrophorhabdus sp. PtaU1.Bin058]|nr:MAG: Long-chain-fatty-acid--CoA ligase [Syntrophorhabdus sp. PtaU1.Bin058]
MLIHEIIEKNALTMPDKEALVFEGQRFSYREVNERADMAAAGLIKLGVKRGDRVALLTGNKPEMIFCGFGCFKIGAMLQTVNYYYTDSETVYVLENGGASTLILSDQYLKYNYAEKAPAFRPYLTDPKTIIVTGKTTPSGCLSYLETLQIPLDGEAKRTLDERKAAVAEDDDAFLVYTGGTTGLPKGVLVSHRGRYAVDESWTYALGLNSGDRYLLSMPLFHLLPWHIVVGTFMRGGTVVLTEAFNAKESLQLIEKEKITCLLGVPTVYVYLNREPDIEKYNLSSLRLGITGGDIFPKERFEESEKKLGGGFRLFNYFGLTEAAGDVTTVTFADPREKAVTTIGRPIPGFEVRIVDNNKNPLPPNEEGEIAVRASWFRGYFRNQKATDETFDKNGWLYTGDLGSIDVDGYVIYLGRKKDMFITGGNNVYPAEIELVLQNHPKILRATVLPVPDEVLGEVGRAYCVPKDGQTLTQSELLSFCKQNMASIKVPKEFVVRDSLPLTDVGKIDKKALKKEIMEEKRPGSEKKNT